MRSMLLPVVVVVGIIYGAYKFFPDDQGLMILFTFIGSGLGFLVWFLQTRKDIMLEESKEMFDPKTKKKFFFFK